MGRRRKGGEEREEDERKKDGWKGRVEKRKKGKDKRR